MYVVISIKNTSRPVGCKAIPHLCVDKFGANNLTATGSYRTVQRTLFSQRPRMSLSIKSYTLYDSSTSWTLLQGVQSDFKFISVYSVFYQLFHHC